MWSISREADMQRAKDRCPACAKLQLKIESGQYVPGAGFEGALHDAPRTGGMRARQSSLAGATGGRLNLQLQQHRPERIICCHCLCTHGDHEAKGPNGQRCCGGRREGPWDKTCERCKLSDRCKAWRNARNCPAEGTEEECTGMQGRGSNCVHCTCGCAATKPHKFDEACTWVAK